MNVNEIRCKSLLNRSRLADYCINPYVGCAHGCRYCYAESYTRRFTKHQEAWGEFVDVKTNAAEVLEKEVQKRSRGRVFLSSLTDAYQPLESKYGITRKILKILLDFQFPVSVQTKSSLVLRDVDLLSRFDSCEVGFTITNLDEDAGKIFEPRSSPTSEKLRAIEQLGEHGISTYVFFGPILPLLSDSNLEEYFQILSGLSISYVYVDKLNIKPGLRRVLDETIRTRKPQLANQWRKILSSKSNYYAEVKATIQEICAKKRLRCEMCF